MWFCTYRCYDFSCARPQLLLSVFHPRLATHLVSASRGPPLVSTVTRISLVSCSLSLQEKPKVNAYLFCHHAQYFTGSSRSVDVDAFQRVQGLIFL